MKIPTPEEIANTVEPYHGQAGIRVGAKAGARAAYLAIAKALREEHCFACSGAWEIAKCRVCKDRIVTAQRIEQAAAQIQSEKREGE